MTVGTTTKETFQVAWPDGGVYGPTMNEVAAIYLVGDKNAKIRGKKNKFRLFKITTVTTIEEIPV
jgi:hypothetical protein